MKTVFSIKVNWDLVMLPNIHTQNDNMFIANTYNIIKINRPQRRYIWIVVPIVISLIATKMTCPIGPLLWLLTLIRAGLSPLLIMIDGHHELSTVANQYGNLQSLCNIPHMAAINKMGKLFTSSLFWLLKF